VTRIISDLSQLPRVADSWTFLYTERVRIERADWAIELRDKSGRVAVPVAALSALMLGPGSTITHAAIMALAETGCSIVWCGEHGARFYAGGIGETRKSRHLEAQAEAWASPEKHAQVVHRMYSMRFPEGLPEGLTLQQVRGREGVRVRDAYARIAKETGIAWQGRSYRQDDWGAANPINRALSTANATLYALCHAVIVATGFSPGLGFVHVGKQLSFVYDVADLYKVEITVPAAFRASAASPKNLETTVRRTLRDLFHSTRLLERIVPDLQSVVGLTPERTTLLVHRGDDLGEEQWEEPAADGPGPLWNDKGGPVAGGRNFAPGLAKATERGDAFEEDVDRPSAASDDDEVPF
jgi:CRISPR-associated protein Cas1